MGNWVSNARHKLTSDIEVQQPAFPVAVRANTGPTSNAHARRHMIDSVPDLWCCCELHPTSNPSANSMIPLTAERDDDGNRLSPEQL
jgi:hypothetical protein